MAYAIDPELEPVLALLPAAGADEDLEATRAMLLEFLGPMNADVDLTGIRVTDRLVPGPAGAPDVPVRVYAPEGSAPAGGRARRCSTSTGAASSSARSRWSTASAPPSSASSASSWSPSSTASLPSTPSRRRSRTATPRCAGCTTPPTSSASTATASASAGRAQAGARGGHRAARPRPRWTAHLLPVPGHPRARPPARDREHARLHGHADVEPSAGDPELAALPRRRSHR